MWLDVFRSMAHTLRRTAVALAVTGLALASLACQIDLGGPEPPGPPVPIATDAAAQLQDSWKSAVEAAVLAGEVQVILDETQITSFLALRLEEKHQKVFHDPQVYLREESIQIYGLTSQGPLTASVLVAVTPRVTPEGNITFEIQTADIGPLPAPDALKESLSAILTEAFTGSLGPFATGLRIKALAIADGQIAIVGEIR